MPNEQKAKRKLTAILSADVKGYSLLMSDDEAYTVETLKSYRALMSEQIEKHTGRVVDDPGDNVLVEFASVVDAVQCAVEIQKILKKKNEDLPEDKRLEFRIGVNIGDVIQDGDRIYGNGVNVAARIEGLADAGGVCISRNAYDHISDKLNFGYEYLGEHSVKNIKKPVRVYKLLMADEDAGKLIEERTKPLAKNWVWATIVLVAVVIGVFVTLVYHKMNEPDFEPAKVENMAYPLPDKPSIAILPFDNMSKDPKHEYICDGLTEEIIAALSKIPKLFVIARNSTFTYKGKPVKVQQVAEELGVHYVLEGSIRIMGNKIRVTAQLIDAIKGTHLWAERYNRELKDIFDIQDEITKSIITEVQVQLTAGEQARLRAAGTNNLDAYLKFLQGWEASRIWTKEAKIKARRLAEETIALDPNYQNGYFLLAVVEIHEILVGLSKSPKDSLARAIKWAKKSIEIEDSPAARRTLAGCYVRIGKYEEAIAEAKKAVELGPNYADAYMMLGQMFLLSDMAVQAIPTLQKAIRLNPYPPSMYYHNLAYAYLFLDKYEDAIEAAKLAIHVSHEDTIAQRALVAAYWLSGRESEAHSQAKELLRIDPDFSVELVQKTSAAKNREKTNKIVEALRKAGLPD